MADGHDNFRAQNTAQSEQFSKRGVGLSKSSIPVVTHALVFLAWWQMRGKHLMGKNGDNANVVGDDDDGDDGP